MSHGNIGGAVKAQGLYVDVRSCSGCCLVEMGSRNRMVDLRLEDYLVISSCTWLNDFGLAGVA
jgi:hypothetical protein